MFSVNYLQEVNSVIAGAYHVLRWFRLYKCTQFMFKNYNRYSVYLPLL